jgi:mannose-1-phosphate guanylyltransferase / mannose-6-phosphate isomerase
VAAIARRVAETVVAAHYQAHHVAGNRFATGWPGRFGAADGGCNTEHRFMVGEQLREIGMAPSAIMLEPAGRNTAPAIAVAAMQLLAHSHDPLMLVLPADHVIADVQAFQRAVEIGRQAAEKGRLVTFGIVPRGPETGYGYIQRGAAMEELEGVFNVARFVEKPNLETAQSYVAAGDYFWNSGMFLFDAATFLEELEAFEPKVLEMARAAFDRAYTDLDFCRLGEAAFKASPSVSVDYAVMEKTSRASVVPADIGWNDVGSWPALWDVLPKDARGNATQGETILRDADNCLVHADKRLIAAVGVENLIIVETTDAVLVAHKDSAQDVKKVVEQLQREGRSESEIHKRVYRPWGSYEGIDRGDRFQVKRITVNPGAKLSTQLHHHRAEHWVVVSGTAEILRDGETHLVTENESIYIPLGKLHAISNPGRIPLHIIEVQSGPYLGEDDIVRTEDIYGRKGE